MLILIFALFFDLKDSLLLLEKYRGEKPKNPVKVETIERNQIDKYIDEALEDTYGKGLKNFEKILTFLRVLKEDESYLQKAKELYREQAAAFYNPKDHTLKIIKGTDEDNLIFQGALLHELMHALQDEKIEIYREMERRKNNYDSLMALQSFLEGEALLITILSLGDVNIEEEEEFQILKENSSMIFNNFEEFLPMEEDFLNYEMVLPYKGGINFILSNFEREKWKGIEKYYKFLPCTMEEILHFDKENNPPKDFSKLAKKIKIKGSKKFDSQTFGESFLYFIFSKNNSKEESKKMAEGWDGDKLLLLEKKDGPFILWLINWDTERDLLEGIAGFKNFAEKEGLKFLPVFYKKSSILLFYKGEKPEFGSNIFNILKKMEVQNVYECRSK